MSRKQSTAITLLRAKLWLKSLETIAYKAMLDYDLELKQAGDDSFRFKVNNRYDLVLF